MTGSPRHVSELVACIAPGDDLERAHQADALRWLDSTEDIYRRRKPATPPKHLVAYAAVLDHPSASIFLVEHRLAGLHLPPGGHVEQGEDPCDTVRREVREELGVETGSSMTGTKPVFVTVTRTIGPGSHTDVSLWFAVPLGAGTPIRLDHREFTGGRWWTRVELRSADPAGFEPHLGRFLAKIGPVLS